MNNNNVIWGQITTYDNKTYKDAILNGYNSWEWDWKQTGTRHYPGIQYKDFAKAITPLTKVIILSKGFEEKLYVNESLVTKLKNSGYVVYCLDTKMAMDLYNSMVSHLKQDIILVCHSTC